MILIFLIFFAKAAFTAPIQPPKLNLAQYLKFNNLPIKFAKALKKHELISLVKMESKHNKNLKFQKLGFYILGLHPRSCQKALRTIGQYEDYKNKINFVTKSEYNEKQQSLYLKFETPILPAKFVLNFKLPRIDKPGKYPFTFTRGFLKGLQGTIIAEQLNSKQCLLHMKGKWQGLHTGHADLMFEIFTKTILNIGLKRLIRMSLI